MRQRTNNLFTKMLWLNSCANCGSFQVENQRHCGPCLSRLKKMMTPKSREIKTPNAYKIKVRSLFDWNPWESDLLSGFVADLKGTKGTDMWTYWSQQFVWHQDLLGAEKNYLLCPCWGRSSRPDHATLFARGLSQFLYSEIHSVFIDSHLAPGQTKRLSHQERKKRAINHEIFSQLERPWRPQKSKGDRVIFVDDIVTTGATAEVAFKVLGCPEDFEVWSLFYRTPLRNKSNLDTLLPSGDI
jgi:predicted amidophosphoribosyltransferase